VQVQELEYTDVRRVPETVHDHLEPKLDPELRFAHDAHAREFTRDAQVLEQRGDHTPTPV
jgi:hypothetical protein